MANRRLKNWLDSYMKYTEDTESSPMFHKWVGISMVAGCLRKKTWLALGRIKTFPNLYVVLVAEPGVSRKSQAISYGIDILSKLTEVKCSADAITKEALIQDLEASGVDEYIPGCQEIFKHSSLNIISKEFESFLGQRGENTKMLVMLTDLYDSQELPWKYRTKNSGNSTIPSVFINLLGATTPESLASCLPPSAIGGGLTSRIIFVWSPFKTKKVPIPTMNDALLALKEELVIDLTIISRIIGPYEMSDEAKQKWIDWYMAYDETSISRICTDPAFNGWYSRKPMFLQKLAMIFQACETSDRTLSWEFFQRAIDELKLVEQYMAPTFNAVGKSEIATETDLVMQIIKRHQCIDEKQLMQLVWRDIDKSKLDNVLATAIATGQFRRCYTHPTTNEKGIYYTYAGFK